ncbi:hypothetical protein M0P65_05535 [Candidatus Gracilibacteria bacterium]|nr:hypothetical protein [Candidatus Gracilibacteria bacterium]
MFKIPMNLIPYEELWSKWGKRRAKQLKEFIQAWVVKKNIKDKELMNLHTLYTYRYSIISVPKFLKSRLFSHLTAFGITFKEVSPEYHNIKCENCGTDFRFRTLGAIKKSSCPNCKSISFVR